MLSILIPTLNYNTLPLVEEIWRQVTVENIIFEIIVQDDFSSDKASLSENEKINKLAYCRFEKNNKNLARAKNLNKLIQKARFDWVLLLDCDIFPCGNRYIKNYIDSINKNSTISFGGICYKKEKPINSELLRWKYGSKREEISCNDRKKNPYLTTLTSNILIKKEVFDLLSFNTKILDYGYEDLVFSQNLKENKFTINHIENPAYHLNLETSSAFLTKIRKTLGTLKFIEETKILLFETKIQKTYNLIYKLKLTSIAVFSFKKLRFLAEKNLTSNNPSVLVFDLYRLGYFCLLKSK